MDAEKQLELVFGLIGGLGIFLLGMKNLSEGIQAIAGSSLRRMIAAVTDNRLLAVGVGTCVTTLIQSSSITTVMVVGFVNSGIMTLTQAIGVIMGANIGTTITGWIIAIKIGKYGLPVLGSAAIVYLFSRGDRYRNWATVVMGLGMVFYGLQLMSDACKLIKDTPNFEGWFSMFSADTYLGVLGCAFAGCVLTMLVQSSSATLGITITLAQQGVIQFETAAALVMGENIGTTITAYLATLGATTNARRAAYFHIIFNLLGALWITALFQPYLYLLNSYGPDGVDARIAAAHSIFNVANTILFLPFVPLFARMLETWIPSRGFREQPRLTDLDIRMLETPVLAAEQSRNEIIKMAESCEKMLGWTDTIRRASEPEDQLVQKLKQREKILDRIQDEISRFVTDLLASSVPHAVAVECRCQLELANEYESVSDYIRNIGRFDQKLRQEGLAFTETQLTELHELHQQVSEYLATVNAGVRTSNQRVDEQTRNLKRAIGQLIKDSRKRHLAALAETSAPPQVTVAFLNTLNAYGRVRDHIADVAEAIPGDR